MSTVLCIHTNGTSPDDLLLRLDFRDEAPQIIDLSPKDGVVSRLQESKIECMAVNKVLLFSIPIENFSNCSIGYLSLLFSPPLSWPIPDFHVIYRWYQKA